MVYLTQTPEPDRSQWWPCACVKRGKGGHITHIKLHPPTKAKCGVCGCTKANAEKLKGGG